MGRYLQITTYIYNILNFLNHLRMGKVDAHYNT